MKAGFNPFTRIAAAYAHFKFMRRHRSMALDIVLALFLMLFGFFSVFPLVMTINNAFKPLNELFLFPPRLFVMNPTLDSFRDLALALDNAWVPVSRYVFNTFFITIMGTFGTVIIGSMAAFPLAKYTFPGSRLMGNVIVYALMFSPAVTQIPNFIIMTNMGLVDTHLAIILPALGGTLGVFLMRNFMTQVPDSLVEAAKIDGASELKTWWTVVMPISKPAWITLIILSVQQFWGATGAMFIYTEALKPVGFAISQIADVGVARQGVFAAFSFIMLIVPITVFIVSQSNVIETMASSGIKG